MTNPKATIATAREWLDQADAILITASNGLSITEGLNLFANDDKLQEVLGDLLAKYPISNLLTALSFPYKNQLDHWRAIARIVDYYGNQYQPSSYMQALKKLIGQRPYFVWTSNIDHHFSLAGFKNVFEYEGNWLEAVCSAHPEQHGTYPLAAKLHDLAQKDWAGNLTAADIPRCNQCGAELELNVAGEHFQMAQNQLTALETFLTQYQQQKLLVLELGIGPNNQMIKAPTMQLVAANPNSHYLTINQGQLSIPELIATRSIGFDTSLATAFKEILTGQDLGAKLVAPQRPKPQPSLDPAAAKKQAAILQKFYPNYMVDQGFQPGSLPMYLTIDPAQPSYLHTTEYGQGLMYDLGDAAIVHCFTPTGKYYQIRLGLDKTKGEVHSAYVDAGTFIAIEAAGDSGAGFSLLNTEIPANSDAAILVPKRAALLKLFPDQQALIKRLLVV